MKKQIDPEHTGKGKYLKHLHFNSLGASAMVQTLPTGEIIVCDNPVYNRSNSNRGYIYTLDIK